MVSACTFHFAASDRYLSSYLSITESGFTASGTASYPCSSSPRLQVKVAAFAGLIEYEGTGHWGSSTRTPRLLEMAHLDLLTLHAYVAFTTTPPPEVAVSCNGLCNQQDHWRINPQRHRHGLTVQLPAKSMPIVSVVSNDILIDRSEW